MRTIDIFFINLTAVFSCRLVSFAAPQHPKSINKKKRGADIPLLLMEVVGNLVTQMQQSVHAIHVNHYTILALQCLEISYVSISKTSITLR